MSIEAPHFSEVDPALQTWVRAEIEAILNAGDDKLEEANAQVLKLAGKAQKSGAMSDRMKAWLLCKALAEREDIFGAHEFTGQQQILAGFAYMHPTVDKGYYTDWIKTHPGPDDAPRADEDLKLYSDIFSPDNSKK